MQLATAALMATLTPALLLADVSHAAPPSPASPSISVHQADLEAHRSDPWMPRIVPPQQRLLQGNRKSVNRVVYGYYPYWLHDLTSIRWEALTHLAWFSVEMSSSGGIGSTHGWPDQATVQAAHTAGVRVDLAFTLFSASGIETLCTSPTNRAAAIKNMIDLLEAGGADGISVDFEGLNAAVRQPFVTFIAELRAGLDARGHQDAEISIAGPAVDWSKAVDLNALLDHATYYFIMGYDYFWSGSTRAGPSGILRVTKDWAPYASQSALRSIAYYSSLIPADKRHQVIYGVPYYGREWTTTTSTMGSTTTASVGSVTYSAALEDLASGKTRQWHAGIQTPWYVWQQSGVWHQVYYDDAQSLAAKYDLALDQDLAGVGMWALNHDKPHQELWDLLETKLGPEPATPEGHRNNPIAIDSFPFHDERDTTFGPSNYFNYYSCGPTFAEYGREWVYEIDVCQPGTVTAHVPAYANADPDLHLLAEADQDTCMGRGHTDLTAHLDPGRYLLTVDTFVEIPVELEGPYELDVDFVPDPGSSGCATHLGCSGGDCICTQPSLTDCGSACVDLTQDDEHCGACDNSCGVDYVCSQGSCVPTQQADGGAGGSDASSQLDAKGGDAQGDDGQADGGISMSPLRPSPAAESEEDAGCTCATGPSRSTPWSGLVAGMAAVVALRTRRRRC